MQKKQDEKIEAYDEFHNTQYNENGKIKEMTMDCGEY